MNKKIILSSMVTGLLFSGCAITEKKLCEIKCEHRVDPLAQFYIKPQMTKVEEMEEVKKELTDHKYVFSDMISNFFKETPIKPKVKKEVIEEPKKETIKAPKVEETVEVVKEKKEPKVEIKKVEETVEVKKPIKDLDIVPKVEKIEVKDSYTINFELEEITKDSKIDLKMVVDGIINKILEMKEVNTEIIVYTSETAKEEKKLREVLNYFLNETPLLDDEIKITRNKISSPENFKVEVKKIPLR